MTVNHHAPIHTQPYLSITHVIVLVTLVKLALALSSPKALYYSTDFDVHRNWLAITRHLPLSEWYFDDQNGQTRHTLDYPPMFAFFEYLIANNPLTNAIIQRNDDDPFPSIDERCLESLPDYDNSVSHACVAFHRLTVVVCDSLFVIGVAIVTKMFAAILPGQNLFHHRWTISLLLLTNPGLIMLDHIHFQYNGMMLGILILSVGFMVNRNYLLGAVTYAMLISMKHLYITLGPLYFIYLLKIYCYRYEKNAKGFEKKFCFRRFLSLAVLTLLTIVPPFLLFVLSSDYGAQTQFIQIKNRLFPFTRGLCHDYWAANVWALYLFAEKVGAFLSRAFPLISLPESLPEVSPTLCASILFLGILPSLICAWKYCNRLEEERNKLFFVNAVIYCAFTSFMLAYHTHEKAIMTAIVPLSLVATSSRGHAQLYLRSCAFGHFGLFPLLFRHQETLLKTILYITHVFLSIYLLQTINSSSNRGLITLFDKLGIFAILLVFIFGEIVHPYFLRSQGYLEFLPLMIQSITCAFGLVVCWIHSCILMVEST